MSESTARVRPTARRARVLSVTVLLLALFSAAGCRRSAAVLDKEELDSEPVRRALALEHEGKDDQAVRAYREILDTHPRVARAHLGLAFLLDKPNRDYIGAIYHYRRYLELRPHTEKRSIIEERIRNARVALAAELFSQSSEMTARIGDLDKENRLLRLRIQELERDAAGTPGTSDRGGTARVRSAGASAPAFRTYRVEPHDTLIRIAKKIYNDPAKWKKIADANREALGNRQEIRIGQVLVIPD